MAFLKAILEKLSGKREEHKKLTEEEILQAIDELEFEKKEAKSMSFYSNKDLEGDYEVLTRIPAPKLWSNYKYLSSSGTDEYGNPRIYFVIPTGVNTEAGNQSVDYLYFPLNGTHLDILERTLKVGG